MKLLVSACLLGLRCRYDGRSKPNGAVLALRERHTLIPCCPEQLGGLPTPRSSAEWQGEKIVNRAGQDVTAQYRRGGGEAVVLARVLGCEAAVLKERSPACGSREIYDGSFTGVLKPGKGSAAAALEAAGIPVFSESDVEKLGELTQKRL